MTVECVIFIIGVIIQISATSVWQQVCMGRWVSGLAVGALSSAVPMVNSTSLLSFHLFIFLLKVSSRNCTGEN
jgi:hypothetical protein